jgi:hypothetical protein
MPHTHRGRPGTGDSGTLTLQPLPGRRRNACCGEEVCPGEVVEQIVADGRVPLVDTVRVVARSLARSFIFEDSELPRRFSQTFELPSECALANEFIREYRRERLTLESRRSAAAGVLSA